MDPVFTNKTMYETAKNAGWVGGVWRDVKVEVKRFLVCFKFDGEWRMYRMSSGGLEGVGRDVGYE